MSGILRDVRRRRIERGIARKQQYVQVLNVGKLWKPVEYKPVHRLTVATELRWARAAGEPIHRLLSISGVNGRCGYHVGDMRFVPRREYHDHLMGEGRTNG